MAYFYEVQYVMNKFRYLQSFEILTVVLKTFRNNEELSIEFLKKIASVLDGHFSGNEFQSILQTDIGLEKPNSPDNESLFLDFRNIHLKFSNLKILSFKEKLSISASTLNWFKQFGYHFPFEDIFQRIILLDDILVEDLEYFFSDENEHRKAGKNEVFIIKNEPLSSEELEGDWIDSNKPSVGSVNSYFLHSLDSPLKVLFIHEVKIFLIRCLEKKSSLLKNSQKSVFGFELIAPGDSIQINQGEIIDYFDIKSLFLKQNCVQKLSLSISNLSFSYPNGKGIRSFNLEVQPGTLSGVIGVEGSGKSTFLRLLAGEITGNQGDIFINGYSLRKELYLLKGMIGYVPQDDLLFNELTVYENLYIPARLYLGKDSSQAIKKKVDTLINELDLSNIKHTVVGSYQDKNILPGQRRLINIALELLRDPPILIVDNALTPLSQSDSSKIIEILSNYSYKDKIVFTSITQTDSDTFASFDRIFVMDEGGFPVYYGKSREAWEYFSEIYKLPVNQQERIGPESILHLINKKNDMLAGNRQQRYFSPLDLYNRNTEISETSKRDRILWKLLPENLLHPPTLDRQYFIFSLRNFKTKIARSREMLFSTLIAPVLAILLSIALHSSTDTGYNFSSNDNIPAFYFISILFAILFGLIQSVNEIYRERQIIRKQEYLNLSRFSYINSKITYLFIIGLIQSFFYLLISSWILRIRSVFVLNWLILFSSFSFGILLGLILSDTHRSLEILYARTIPLIIILQLLFGGGFIDINSARPASKNNTSLISDFMVSRWGYEAAMVNQFQNNDYESYFYDTDRIYALCEINTLHLLSALKAQLNYCKNHFQDQSDTLKSLLHSIHYTLDLLATNHDIFPYENMLGLTVEDFDEDIAEDASEYLEYLEFYFFEQMERSEIERNKLERKIADSLGTNFLDKLKAKFYNYSVADKVLKKEQSESIKYYKGIPFQTRYPIYQYPQSDLGRGQMFLPEKQFSGERIDTIEFNISIIWLINLLLYIILITNLTGIKKKANPE